MTTKRWTPVALLRNHAFKVSVVDEVGRRIDDLETGLAESRRQQPALARDVDRLEAEVIDLAARRVAQREHR